MIRRIVRGCLGRLRHMVIVRECLYDALHYLKYSGTLRRHKNRESFRAELTMNYHCVEKALSLKETRIRFGRSIVDQLIADLRKYLKLYGADETARVVLNVLKSYNQFHAEHGCLNEDDYRAVEELEAMFPEAAPLVTAGGALAVTRDYLQSAVGFDFERFASIRFSIRHFAAGEVNLELIKKAISIARKTPSVCNRQPWKVHVYLGEEAKNSILRHQAGNQGFGDSAGALLVVTSPLTSFFGVGERNEAYVDGGMFAMSLVYALHSLSLGSCCLNLCHTHRQVAAFRAASGIPHDEVLVMMIAVGEIPEELQVAMSHRRPVDEMICLH